MVLTLVWLLVILFFSIVPIKGPQTGHVLDKIAHFIIYGITAIIFFRLLRSRMLLTKSATLSIGLASFYGLAMELLQSALPWREFSFSDEVANISGALIFCVIYAIKDYHGKKLNIIITSVYRKDD